MPSNNQVNVTITQTATSITIQVDNEPFNLKGLGTGSNAVMTWAIATAGWTFANNGIAIQGAAGKFQSDGPKANGMQYKWHRQAADPNPPYGPYKYAITVTNGSQTASWDPTIINEP